MNDAALLARPANQSQAPASARSAASVFCFSVHAEAHPSSLARVLDVFTLYGDLPTQLVSRREGPDGRDLVVDAQMDALCSESAAAVARRLLRVVGVSNVLYSEKRHARPTRLAA